MKQVCLILAVASAFGFGMATRAKRGTINVPISFLVSASCSTGLHNGVMCYNYPVSISSTDSAAHNGTLLAVSDGCDTNVNSVNVPASGSVSATVYVPTNFSGTAILAVYFGDSSGPRTGTVP